MSRASAAFVRQEAYTIAPASSRFVVTTAAPSVRSSRISRKPQYCCSSRSPVFRREREGLTSSLSKAKKTLSASGRTRGGGGAFAGTATNVSPAR